MFDMQKYSFKLFDSRFSKLYKREYLKLRKIIGKDVEIEHMGSTSVKGLGGKGILDVMIAANRKDIKSIKRILNKNDYEFRPNSGDKDRLYFRTKYKENPKIRKVHIHLTTKNSKIWKEAIALRNYLRKNPEVARNYEEIKKKAVIFAKGNGKKYRKYKESFLKKIIKKIRK